MKESRTTIRAAINLARRDKKAWMTLSDDERQTYCSLVPRVASDGTVTVNGERVGSVEKVTQGTSIPSAIMGTDGPPRWIPRDRDGKALINGWERTRAEAAHLVARCAEPMRVDVKRERTSLDGPHAEIWDAHVNVEGHTFGVSRFDNEGHWFVFYLVQRGAFMPSLSTLNYVRPAQVVARPDVVRALNEAANSQGASFTMCECHA